MSSISRREFTKQAASSTGAAAPAVRVAWGRGLPGERINVAVVGFRSRGRNHCRASTEIADFRVAYLCDVDGRLFPAAAQEV